MSNCSASCTSVRSPLIAAIATFALKADVWFRRGLLLMLSPDSRAKSCPLSGRSSTYRPVQILEAGSEWPDLRRAYMPFPWAHLYEHPHNVATVVLEREWRNAPAVFYDQIQQPEKIIA